MMHMHKTPEKMYRTINTTATKAMFCTALLAATSGVLAQEQNAPAQPARGGTLVVTYALEQRALSPGVQAALGVYQIGAKIQEPLIDLSNTPDGGVALEPVLATAWSSSEDGLAITVKLREGVRWHDGVEFTAADVAYSAMNVWKTVQNYGNVLFADLASVDTPDKHTAVFRFSRPMPLELFTFAMPDLGSPVPKHLYEGKDVRANPANLAPVGTGPFKFIEYKRGQYVLLERNPAYWRAGLPYLDKIQFRILGSDHVAAAAAMEAGSAQLSVNTQVSLSDTGRLGNIPFLDVSDRGNEGATWLATLEFNMRRPELADVRVRQAIHHAIDTDFILKNVFYGYARPATGPIPSTEARFYEKNVQTYPFDPARANALLDEAGYPRDARGVRLSVRLAVAPWFEFYSRMADVIKQQLQNVGIQVEAQSFDGPGYLTRVYRTHDFDLSVGSSVYRNDPAISTTSLYRSGAPAGIFWSNQYGWLNAGSDTLIDAARSEINPDKRAALYKQWQALVAEELPILMLVEHGFIAVVNQRVKNTLNTPRWSSSSWADTWMLPD